MGAGMYSSSGGGFMSAMFLHRRVAFGASRIVRYPDDPYDRMWEPSIPSDSLSILQANSTSIDTIFSDSPPISGLQTCVPPSKSSLYNSIPLKTNLPSDNALNIYINLYFNDMFGEDFLVTRSIAVYMDGDQITDRISLINGQFLEYRLNNFTATGRNQFELRAVDDSSLPPIINAMEVFTVSEELTNATDSSDVGGLATLIIQFDVLKDWSGDPCLPKSYNWDWVGCNSDYPPRITSINLGGFGLSGELPDFNILTALETMDMHNNSISGGIPDFIGLSNLKELATEYGPNAWRPNR